VVELAIAIAEAAGGDVNIIQLIAKIGKVAIDLAAGVCPAPTAIEYLYK